MTTAAAWLGGVAVLVFMVGIAYLWVFGERGMVWLGLGLVTFASVCLAAAAGLLLWAAAIPFLALAGVYGYFAGCAYAEETGKIRATPSEEPPEGHGDHEETDGA